MASNGDLNTEVLEIPAKVYPGMFEREFQATISVLGLAITVIVSTDDVIFEGTLSEAGVNGKLKVFLVDSDDKGLLIDLPGEPLGTTRRFRIPSAQAGGLFAST